MAADTRPGRCPRQAGYLPIRASVGAAILPATFVPRLGAWPVTPALGSQGKRSFLSISEDVYTVWGQWSAHCPLSQPPCQHCVEALLLRFPEDQGSSRTEA
ncbi:Hypothetical predicted protein [Marmota monax]|uniref:Uncharacterized protein n=1 Tax=Marmota monax TaxID=9995 RepID=A0A5E4AAM8_MARMO|nr:Hypothetical predicted protein [Marmota monax]